MRRDRLAPRLVLTVGIALGVWNLLSLVRTRPDLFALDYRVYHLAARAALAGTDIYAVSPPGVTFRYVYPPATVLAFVPFALLPWRAGFAALTLLKVGVGVGFASLLVQVVESAGESLGPRDRALVVGFVLLSVHAAFSLYLGQINLLLASSLGVGFVAVARGRDGLGGVALALPAVFKVFPGAAGLWLLRRRSWRAVAAALATGLATLALGLAIFGVDAHVTYVQTAVLDRFGTAAATRPDTAYVTLRRPLDAAFPAVGPLVLTLGGVALVTPVLWRCYRRDLRNPMHRLLAIYATMAATLVVVPAYFTYLVFLLFPLVPLLYLLRSWPARPLFLAGAFLTNVSYTRGTILATLDGSGVPPTIRLVLGDALAVASVPLLGLCLTLLACALAD